MPGRGRGRGRGRGAGRGGRGRGGRGRFGRSRGRGAYHRSHSEHSDSAPEAASNEPLDVNKDVKAFFVGSRATMDDHYTAQETNCLRYAAGMAVMDKSGIEISQSKYQQVIIIGHQFLLYC